MALRADVDIQIALDRTRLEGFPTGTLNGCLDVFGMDAFFHLFHLSWDMARIPAIGLDTYATPEFALRNRFYYMGYALSIIVIGAGAAIIAAISGIVV